MHPRVGKATSNLTESGVKSARSLSEPGTDQLSIDNAREIECFYFLWLLAKYPSGEKPHLGDPA